MLGMFFFVFAKRTQTVELSFQNYEKTLGAPSLARVSDWRPAMPSFVARAMCENTDFVEFIEFCITHSQLCFHSNKFGSAYLEQNK